MEINKKNKQKRIGLRCDLDVFMRLWAISKAYKKSKSQVIIDLINGEYDENRVKKNYDGWINRYFDGKNG